MTSAAPQVSSISFQPPVGAALLGAGNAPLERTRAADSFDNALKQAGAKGQDALTDAANQLVASAFVLPVLSSMHDSPLRPQAGPFAQGTIEKRFGPLLDQQFADRITQASNFGIVRSIVERYGKHAAAGPTLSSVNPR